MSRGLRNNNPGNIRISGVGYAGEITPSADPAFKQFKTILWGYRAMFVLLHTYRVRYSLDTVEKMIGRYAPPVENDTRGYVRYVSLWSGVAADRVINTLDGSVMIPVVAAMSRMENGVSAVDADVVRGWELFMSTAGA